MIKESASNFIRWKPGTCHCYDSSKDSIPIDKVF